MPSWDEFTRRQRSEATEQTTRDMADVCATVFTTTAGKQLMQFLYETYIDKRVSAGAPDAMLREAEAERRVVAKLEALRDQGLERRAAEANKPKS